MDAPDLCWHWTMTLTVHFTTTTPMTRREVEAALEKYSNPCGDWTPSLVPGWDKDIDGDIEVQPNHLLIALEQRLAERPLD
jgi:hypothetical protein